jgi:circadian clock protein KaiC
MTVDDSVERISNTSNADSFKQFSTGVRGLDEVLGGGIPEYSFNLIAGAPGTGKTSLAQQIMFGLATPERPALHFTVVGEPAIKMLRYQQRFTFFDKAKVGSSVHYRNIDDETLDKGIARCWKPSSVRSSGSVRLWSWWTRFAR